MRGHVRRRFNIAHLPTWRAQHGTSAGLHKLFQFSAAGALGVMRRYLAMLGVLEAQQFTWKSIRAGRATQMAAQGFTLGAILTAGEWRSAAVFKYLHESDIDAAEVLRQALDVSDDEAGDG